MGRNYPKVSIVIPTYNRVNYIKECLESIINQNYPNVEIIVSDDNSTDNTKDLLKDYTKRYPFIKYIKNTKYPKGPNGNKNNGLDYANGEIIGIFDDDDIMLENAINLLVNKINEGYDMVIANCIRSDNNEFSGKGLSESQEVFYKDYLCEKIQGEFWGLFKKSILNNKRFDTDIFARESTLWKGLWKNKKIFYIHKAVRLYRIHNESISNNSVNYFKIMKSYEREIEYYKDDMKKYCPCHLSFMYALSAYFAKLSGNIQKSFKYVFNSLKFCPSNKKSYIVLGLNFLPKNFVIFLLNLKQKIKN